MIARFRPEIHGWPFTNFFPVRNWFAYGLCGGMVFSALDCYYYDVPIPEVESPSPQIWRYLVKRQLASMKPSDMLAMFGMMMLPIEDVRRYVHGQLWQTAMATFPQPLLLVRTRRWLKPHFNHQVLAIRSTASRIYIYDPNYPKMEVWLNYHDDHVDHCFEGDLVGIHIQDYREPSKPPVWR